MELWLILAAFAFGFLAARAGLPPLVGYLAAGFVLHAFGFESNDAVELIAELGVLLLLFGVGLKLSVKTLSRRAVWMSALIHASVFTILFGAALMGLGALGFPLLEDLDPDQGLIIGLALAFSSTVYAVKALEDRNESASLAGLIAVGILIVQDLIAVGFLAFSEGDLPSAWAVPVVALVVAARPLYSWILDRTGHGELLMLLGFLLAIGIGAGLFDLVGLKPDLGALVVGVTLSGHPRARDLSDKLLGLKDILLVGFFLSIGLAGIPSTAALLVAGIAMLFLPLKAGGYLALLPASRLRARTSWHTAVTLGTFSEFGLIVVAAGVAEGLIDSDWSGVFAVLVAVSFAVAAPLNSARYDLYRRWSKAFERIERHPLLPEDSLIEPGDARVLVFGMGRVGVGAFDEIERREGPVVLGVDRSDDVVKRHSTAGRNVIRGDALDSEFWERIRLHPGIELVVVSTSDHLANLTAVGRVREFVPSARIAAGSGYSDEVEELEHAGVDVARNLMSEAGQGLADDACDLLAARRGDDPPSE